MTNLIVAYGCLILLVVTATAAARDLRGIGPTRWAYAALIVFVYPIGLAVWLLQRCRLVDRREL